MRMYCAFGLLFHSSFSFDTVGWWEGFKLVLVNPGLDARVAADSEPDMLDYLSLFSLCGEMCAVPHRADQMIQTTQGERRRANLK